MMIGSFLNFSFLNPNLVLICCVAILAVVYTVAAGRRKKLVEFEKVGVSYDNNGDLLWICRSSEAKQVFTIRADAMNRVERRRTWSAGFNDEISTHLKSLNR